MTELEKAARMALEALKSVTDYDKINEARRALTQALATTEHLIYEDGSPGPKLHSPEWFAAKRQEAVDRIASMPESIRRNMHYAAATMPATTERKGEPVGIVCGHARDYHKSQLSASFDRFVKPGTPLYTSPQVPEGFALVPMEPTPEMIATALRECGGIGGGSCGEYSGVDGSDFAWVWQTMVDAARKGE